MSSLLIRLEIAPEKSNIFDVPPAHVLHTIFTHGQPSSLRVVENNLPIGTLWLQPHEEPGRRAMQCSGNLWMRLPMLTRQRVSWSGNVEFGDDMNPRELHCELILRDPACRVDVHLDEQRLHYEIWQANKLTTAADMGLDAARLAEALRSAGIDPSLFANLPHARSAPDVTARQTEMLFHGEKITVFKMTVRQGESTLAEFSISQLGQILEATTLFGYSLSATD